MMTIQGLDFAYPKGEEIFNNINLTIKRGGIYGLLGKNGSGKTTFLKLLSGLLFPQAGECLVNEMHPKDRLSTFLSDIYYLPEDVHAPAFSGKTFIKLYADFYPRFDHGLMDQFLKEWNLPKNKLLNTLSHGQKKKFFIAFGLACQTRIFLLDEPSNGLDIPSKALFRKLLAGTISDDKLFLISTHQVHDIENLIEEIIVLNEGKIIFHENLMRVSEKLAFTKEFESKTSALYSEKCLGAYNTVSLNETGLETEVDLEMLFNTILSQPEMIQKIFARKLS